MADTQIMPQPIAPSTKKRKRNADHSSSKRASLAQNNEHLNGASQSFSAEAFAQQLQDATQDLRHSVGNATALALGEGPSLSFTSNGTGADHSQLPSSFDLSDPSTQPGQASPYIMVPGYKPSQENGQPGSSGQETSNGTPGKPTVGSDEWQKLRRDNHKEVERRRREAINEGINALATIVPNCEKNKGSILQKAVTYINELRAQVADNGQKKVMEKTVLEQAVHELTAVNSSLQEQMKNTIEENESLKKRLREFEGDDTLDEE